MGGFLHQFCKSGPGWMRGSNHRHTERLSPLIAFTLLAAVLVQIHLLDVIRDGRIDKSAERLSSSHSFADSRCRNCLVNAVEQMDRNTVQNEITLRRLFFKRLGDVRGGTEFFR